MMQARRLTRRALIERLPAGSTRWAVYRLLSRRSSDPRLSTFIAICQALEVSPTELAQFSGLLEHKPRGESAHVVRLRRAFGSLLQLEQDFQEMATEMIEETVRVFQKRSPMPAPNDGSAPPDIVVYDPSANTGRQLSPYPTE